MFNLATCCNYSRINYLNILVFYILEKVNNGQLKMVNVNYQKWPDLATLSFNKIIKETGIRTQYTRLCWYKMYIHLYRIYISIHNIINIINWEIRTTLGCGFMFCKPFGPKLVQILVLQFQTPICGYTVKLK